MITEASVTWSDYMDMGFEDREWLIEKCIEIQDKRDDEMNKSKH